MGERWFSDDELREMSRPTMELAVEAIERGDLEEAKALCEREKHEAQFMHDMGPSMDRVLRELADRR